MKYIYTIKNCGDCYDLKKAYDLQGIQYIERDASRLTNPESDVDEIDKIAFAKLADNNDGMTFPVEVVA